DPGRRGGPRGGAVRVAGCCKSLARRLSGGTRRASRESLLRNASAIVIALLVPTAAQAQRGADVSTRFQEPTEERRIELGEEASAPTTRRARAASDLEERLYLRERPDALGAAAREFHDEQLQTLLREREGLLVERR